MIAGQQAALRASARRGYRTVARTRGIYAKGEMKYFDCSYGATQIAANSDWTGTESDPTTLDTLFVPTQGSAINQRIGREVKVHKIKIRGLIAAPAQTTEASPDNAQFIRMILVQDTQTNATQMQGEQLIGSGSSDTIASFQNLDNTGRFKVLKDKTFALVNANISGTSAAATIIQSGMGRWFKINHTFKVPVSVRFNATNGGSIADIVDNSFHILCNSVDSALAARLSYQARICYKE